MNKRVLICVLCSLAALNSHAQSGKKKGSAAKAKVSTANPSLQAGNEGQAPIEVSSATLSKEALAHMALVQKLQGGKYAYVTGKEPELQAGELILMFGSEPDIMILMFEDQRVSSPILYSEQIQMPYLGDASSSVVAHPKYKRIIAELQVLSEIRLVANGFELYYGENLIAAFERR
jgi:hypothetical protein